MVMVERMRGCVDLHTHTTASDGTDSSAELIRKAAEIGLAAVAVTDHDTLSGLAEAVAAGERHGVEVVRGCEVAVASACGETHVLGLWMTNAASRFESALADFRAERHMRNERIITKLRLAGYDITYSEVLEAAGESSVGRPHIARLLVDKGVCSSTRDAFAQLLGDGKPMYEPRNLPDARRVLTELRKTGAVTVLAHPMLLAVPLGTLELTVAEFAEAGLDALEVFHSDHHAKAVRRAARLADRYGLAVSGGSDFHGSTRGDVALGAGRGNLRLPYSMLEELRMLYNKRELHLQQG